MIKIPEELLNRVVRYMMSQTMDKRSRHLYCEMKNIQNINNDRKCLRSEIDNFKMMILDSRDDIKKINKTVIILQKK